MEQKTEPIWNAFGIDKPYCPKGLEYLEYIINNNNYIYIHSLYIAWQLIRSIMVPTIPMRWHDNVCRCFMGSNWSSKSEKE